MNYVAEKRQNKQTKQFPVKQTTAHLPTATIMSKAGTPKANGKQEFEPKQWTSSRRMGVTKVEISDPALMAK